MTEPNRTSHVRDGQARRRCWNTSSGRVFRSASPARRRPGSPFGRTAVSFWPGGKAHKAPCNCRLCRVRRERAERCGQPPLPRLLVPWPCSLCTKAPLPACGAVARQPCALVGAASLQVSGAPFAIHIVRPRMKVAGPRMFRARVMRSMRHLVWYRPRPSA